jgi:hypothetical protein
MSSDSSEAPTSNFEDIDILYEFGRRSQRLPEYRAEHEAMAVLVAEMAENPRNMLQQLVETAQRLCNATAPELVCWKVSGSVGRPSAASWQYFLRQRCPETPVPAVFA